MELSLRCAKELTMETFKKGKDIIKYGGVGHKYYILISGKISFYIFSKAAKVVDLSLNEYIEFHKDNKGLILSINGREDFDIPEESFDKKTFKRGMVNPYH